MKVVAGDRLIAYGSALDVSMGGILVRGDPPLSLGTRVGVVIFLADGEGANRIVTQGTVVRSDPGGNAIEFVPGMGEEQARALALLVEAHHPEAAPGP